MPTAEDIISQQRQLDQHRANVRTLLEQIAAQGGSTRAPLGTLNSLAEARTEIAARKSILRTWGISVEDLPDDQAAPPSAERAAGQGPHQLRAPVADFVGRDEALARLVAALRPSPGRPGAPVCGVRGMGGIGKTELAHAAAVQLAADYPDAHLLLELRGAGDAPLSPAQALQQVISAFHLDEKLPEELGALQARYRSVLAGRRVLIVADDARDAAQVRPLLPPVGCALLVTSRQRLLLDGMVALDLERLDEAAAVQLLRGICGRLDENQARQLAWLCGGLPLALRVSAGILASNPSRSAARYLAQLADERQVLAALRAPDDPERDVEAVLRLSYAGLEPTIQQQFRRLGVLAADADLGLIAALLELGPTQAEVVLELLLRHSLVEYDAARERWGLHDLVRAFALGLLADAGEERAVRLRYAEQVLRVMEQAERRYQAGGVGVVEGLALFDQERAHLAAVRSWLWSQPPDAATDTLIWQEAHATVQLGELRDPVRAVQLPQWEQALTVARRRGDRRGEGVALGNLGSAYLALGEVQVALPCYEQHLALAREVGDRAGEGVALGNLGYTWEVLGTPVEAHRYYEQKLRLVRERGDQVEEAYALDALGTTHVLLGHPTEGLTCCEAAWVLAQHFGDRSLEGTVVRDLAHAQAVLGQHAAADVSYREALGLHEAIGYQAGVARTAGPTGSS